MARIHKTTSVKTSNHIASAKQPIPPPPEIAPQLSLKWGLTLLGEERAKQYLHWVRMRLERLEQCAQ